MKLNRRELLRAVLYSPLLNAVPSPAPRSPFQYFGPNCDYRPAMEKFYPDFDFDRGQWKDQQADISADLLKAAKLLS